MKPTGKTTLLRMQRTAMLEAERIEISQDYWISQGRLKEPMQDQAEKRDDFEGIVRLIDAINSDENLVERVRTAMVNRAKAALLPIAPAAPEVDLEMEVTD